ncbi:hypothetical protein ACFFHH_20200 [Cytobacillus solani]|uniref:hypothetical protein n=1 Tax=Cytobacillus solani TaxID=1637975 RepID=UPI00114E1A7D|nr:hypothetical protein [Cytobacillus solani]
MNKLQLINYLEESKHNNLSSGTKVSVLPDYFRQQLLADKVNEIIQELNIQGFLFHATTMTGAIGIHESGMIIPRKNYVADALKENGGLRYRANTITDGTPENMSMGENIFSLSNVIEELKGEVGSEEKVLDYERKIHVLSQLIDENCKIYFHDLPNFTFKWDATSINLNDEGSVLICINPSKVNHRKKYFYFEYVEDIKIHDNSIVYYLDDDSEQYIKDYVKNNAYYQTYEIVAYEPIPIEDIDYLIVFNKQDTVFLIKNNGNGEYQLIKELGHEENFSN